MNQIDKLKELFIPVLEKINIQLYDLEWLGKDKTLRVVITNVDNKVDLDMCVLSSEELSKVLDEDDSIDSEYTLEVCSPGAEREIKDIYELTNMVGSHILVKLKEPYKKLNEIKGDVISANDKVITIEYRDKAAKRKAEINLDNISFARFAVKI